MSAAAANGKGPIRNSLYRSASWRRLLWLSYVQMRRMLVILSVLAGIGMPATAARIGGLAGADAVTQACCAASPFGTTNKCPTRFASSAINAFPSAVSGSSKF